MNYKTFSKTQDTIFEMMKDRRYTIDSVEKLSEEDFNNAINHRLSLTFERSGYYTEVIWVLSGNISISIIQESYKKIQDCKSSDEGGEGGVNSILIVKNDNITAAANSAIASNIEKTIQIFDKDDLINNITKHSLVPKHELMTKTMQDKLLETYSTDRVGLPRISSNDPVIRYYGWKRGNIIKITRADKTIYYRCIV
jgi:DNA-directed RNA polymerase I, II, and III subunit RPABC1